MTFQQEVDRTVQEFLAQISELAQRAAIETLQAAFAGNASRASAQIAGLPAKNQVGRPGGRRGAKRTSAEVEAMSEQVKAYIKSNPGLRIEQINKALGMTTKELALPIRKLVADGMVSTKGQKRATTYFPGKKAK
jgi:predicted HTH transcriptional regulator